MRPPVTPQLRSGVTPLRAADPIACANPPHHCNLFANPLQGICQRAGPASRAQRTRYLVQPGSTANTIVMTSAAVAIIAAVAASMYRWRARTTGLCYQAGFVAGVAWSALRRFAARLLDGFRPHRD